MSSNARLYQCTRCHSQVIICRRCDRGNVYCAESCAKLARFESKKRTEKRYRNSPLGRHTNAQRQRRFRAKKRELLKKVTHQGSPPDTANDLLSAEKKPRQDNHKFVNNLTTETIHCHFCGCECTSFLRSGFIRRPMRRVQQK